MSEATKPAGKVEIWGPKDVIPKADGQLIDQAFGPDAFNFSRTMKERLGPLGRFMISFEERRVARDEIKQVLKNELRAQTELMLNRARLDLQYLKEIDQAAHLERTRKVEEFLFSQQAGVQYRLNEMIDNFEDQFTHQYVQVKAKLERELQAGGIDKSICEMRVQRAMTRYESAMDKTLQDMKMIIDNHKTNLTNTLRTM